MRLFAGLLNSRPSVRDAEDDGKAKGKLNTISAGQVIQHLTKEIEVLSETVMTFRLRAAFTVWIGPYILLGSVIIATKGSFEINMDSPVLLLGVSFIAMGLYLGLGWAAGRIEQQAWKQCNQWRDTISRLAAGDISSGVMLYEGMKFSGLHDRIRRAYLIVFGLILASFLCVGFIAAHVQPKTEATSHAPNTSHKPDVEPPPKK